jgi:predicted nucleic acid-binding protein
MNMIFIDTSVWIEFFKQNPDYVPEVTTLLESKKVVVIELIYAELLYGASNQKEKDVLVAYWKTLPKIKLAGDFLIESAEIANAGNYHNLGVGLIDAVIARVTIQNQFKLWTLDKKLINYLEKKYLYK